MKKVLISMLTVATTLLTSAENTTNKLIGWWKIDEAYVEKMLDEVKKEASESDLKMLKYFLPRVKKMAEKQTIIIDDKNITSVYGDRERVTPYVLVKVEDNDYTLKVGSSEKIFSLIDNRLVDKRELNGKRPAMYMLKLSAEQIKVVKEAIAAAKRPPEPTASADKRINFLVYKASPEQQKTLLKSQPDLLNLVHPSRKMSTLALAIGGRKSHLAKLLVSSGADIKQLNSQGENLLFDVVSSREVDRDLFDLLVAKGLDVKAINKRKETLLIKAADDSKDVEFFKHLLTLGIDVNHKGSFDDTAISEAMEDGKKEMVALLIKSGADISALGSTISRLVRKVDLDGLRQLADNKIYADKHGNTAIMEAASSSSAKVKAKFSEILTMFKPWINEKNSQGETALFATRDLAILKQLVAAGCNPKAKAQFGKSLLHHHSSSALEVLKYFVEEQKLPVDLLNDRKNTPLMLALARCTDTQNTEFLLSKGADVNHIGFSQGTPLSWALGSKNPKPQVELLLKKGVNVNASPLTVISKTIDKPDLLKLLVKNGLSLKVDSKQHYTPFWYAIFNKDAAAVKLLIELGCDPKAKNAAGKTALDIAKEFKNDELIKILSK